MVHLPHAALPAILFGATMTPAIAITINGPIAENNLILVLPSNTTTAANNPSITPTGTTQPPSGPSVLAALGFAHILHGEAEAAAQTGTHRIVSPTDESTTLPTRTGAPLKETEHNEGYGWRPNGAGGNRNGAAGSVVAASGVLRAAGVAVGVVGGIMGFL